MDYGFCYINILIESMLWMVGFVSIQTLGGISFVASGVIHILEKLFACFWMTEYVVINYDTYKWRDYCPKQYNAVSKLSNQMIYGSVIW